MKEIEVTLGVGRTRHVDVVGQAGGRILGGEARNVESRAYGLRQRGGAEVRRAGVAAPLTQVDGNADALVAVALDVLDLALAHRYRQTHALGHFDGGIAGADVARHAQDFLDQGGELLARVRELGSGGSGHGQGKRSVGVKVNGYHSQHTHDSDRL